MGVTIKDVAKKSGVSVTTVSLVLNKKSNRISEKTRQLIENAARELNYIPNHNAVSLVTRKSSLIALMVPPDTYYHYDDFIRSMEYACRNAGYSLNLSLIEYTPEKLAEQIRNVLRYNVEGIVIDPSALSEWTEDLQKELDAHEIPIILTGPVHAQAPENAIMPNYRKVASMAAEPLISLGHTRIGLITGPDTLAVTAEIIAGYRAALEEYGISFREEMTYCGPYQITTGSAGLKQLLDEEISAVITISDTITFGAVRQLGSNHLHMPEDISLVAYGVGGIVDSLDLPITSISSHFDRIARKSVNLIRTYSGVPIQAESIEPTLIERGSTAPYRPKN